MRLQQLCTRATRRSASHTIISLFSLLHLAGVRIFTEWFSSGQFLLSKTATKKKEKNAALQALQGLLSTQYKSQAHSNHRGR